MSSSEMATMHCLSGHLSPQISSDGHTVITADSDLPPVSSDQLHYDKDSGVLSEPEELRRSSKRTRMRRSLVFQEKTAADPQSDGKESATSSTSVTSDDRKKQRSLWTIPETQAFYDALAEHGKDFLSIQTFIHNKLSPESTKKNKSSNTGSRSLQVPVSSTSTTSSTLFGMGHVSTGVSIGVNEVKSREQVRHFYYRTWHKISGSCKFDDVLKSQSASASGDVMIEGYSPEKIQETLKEIDKGVLELYGLINYGEIWKKFPSKWDSRMKSHLKELVLEGTTVIKIGPKAKAIKIKTPVCKALKRLNGLISDVESAQGANPLVQQLPDEIIVQLLPADNESFLKVQSVAQNPRMQCRVCIQKKISSLALFLQQHKWGSDRTRKLLCHESDLNIEELLPDLRCSVKLTLHSSQLCQLNSLNAGLTISQSAPNQPSDLNASSTSQSHTCSSSGISFRSYLRHAQGRKNPSKVGTKAKKEKGSLHQTPPSQTWPAVGNDVTAEDSPNAKICTENVVIEIDDSCSSSSFVAPFRDTVKRLALLNQALGTDEAEPSLPGGASQEMRQSSPPSQRPALEPPETEMVSSSLRDDCEVSLPPPTATLAQWLSSRDDRRSAVDIDLTQEDSELGSQGMDRVHQSPSTTTEHKIVLDIEKIREGWRSGDTSVTFAELYLLLKSPSKILLNYTFLDSDIRNADKRHFKNIACEESPSAKCISLLEKLLTAASISLSMHKKIHVSTQSACFPYGATAVPNASTSASNQLSVTPVSRTAAASTNRSPTATGTKKLSQQILPATQTAALSLQSVPLVTDPATGQHNFLMPTGPAPKAVSNTSGSANPCQGINNAVTCDGNSAGISSSCARNNSSSNKRARIICEDPQVLEDAIKQLNQNRFMPKKKRQRVIRPITVGPVSSKLLLPRQTLQMIPGAATPASHIQILSAPAAVTVPTTDAGNGLSLPICFTPNAVPTILIPTVITANLNTPLTAAGVESDTGPAATMKPAPPLDPIPVSVGHTAEPLSDDPGHGNDLNPRAVVAENLCESAATADLNLSQNSNSSLPCLSSLLELSLPDPTTPVTSTSSSINHSFFSDNSCSSISEFISFGNPNMGQAALPAPAHSSSSGTHVGGKEVSKNGQTPNWLLSEGSNSSSLGLSSLMFNGNELI